MSVSSKKTFRSPLKASRGLGAAKDGTHHWVVQRLSAIALIPLSIWFVYALLTAIMADVSAAKQFVAQPINAILLFLLVEAMLYHGALGVQVVVEDYIHKPCCKITTLVVVKLGTVVLMAAAALAIGKIALG
jgi:succinate dehydrogenase / fumarate reductase membrane anchor subunit